VPRSGTTLSCELLNLLADVRALDEPMHVGPMIVRATGVDGESLDAAAIRREIADFADAQRRSILERGAAVSRHVGGRVSGSRIGDARDESGVRKRLSEKGEIAVVPPASEDFTLVIKHPVLFAAMLERLVGHFEVFAVVRNPVAVLGSWESVPMMVRDGQLGLPASVAPEMARLLEATPDLMERQLLLLEWYFGIFAAHLPSAQVLRYEQIIASGGSSLHALAPSAAMLCESLQGRNKAPVYDRAHMSRAGRWLLERDDASWQTYYSRGEVEELLDAI
jgi:hypothetical protein